jgi:ribosome-binding protein aMBF1 (putative translation factor)
MLRITYERMKRSWSKAALARKSSLDQAQISKMEAGRLKPYPTELRRLAEALDFPEAEAHRLLEKVDDHGFSET